MTGLIDARLKELGIDLPQAGAPVANYVPYTQLGNTLYVAGQICQWNGERRFLGKLGRDLSVEQGAEAAKLCGLNLIAQVKAALGGDLDRLVRVHKIGGFVSSMPDFTDQAKVMNGCSDLMVQVFGDAGRHARTSVGVNVLPLDVAVEIDGIFEVR